MEGPADTVGNLVVLDVGCGVVVVVVVVVVWKNADDPCTNNTFDQTRLSKKNRREKLMF